MTTPATPNVSVGSTEDTSKGGLFVNTSSTNLATEAPESSSTATPAAPDIFSGSTDNAADGSLFTDVNVSGLADANKIVEIIAGTGLTGTSLTGPQATLEIDSTVVTLIGTQTLTNKTLTSPVITGGITGAGNSSLAGNLTLSDVNSGTGASPFINLLRVDTNPLVGDFLGSLQFSGTDNAGGLPAYASIFGRVINPTDGNESGSIEFFMQQNGSFTQAYNFNPDRLLFLNEQDIQFFQHNGTLFDVTLQAATPSADRTVTIPNATGTLSIITATETLTNKTLTNPIMYQSELNTSISGSAFLDEDNMASNSNIKVASQQSIKAYVDTQVATIPVGDITSVVAGTGMTGGGTSGDVTLNVIGGTGITANAGDIAIDSTVTTLTGSQTLTNKTLTSPVLNTSISGTAFLDEDDMASNSNIKVASQQSIKAYVDSNVVASIAADNITTGDAAVTLATSSGNITIDAQGSNTDIIFKGTNGATDITAGTFDMSKAGELRLSNGLSGQGMVIKADNGNIELNCESQDNDIVFKGNDGGSSITALTLDMSSAGFATFNNGVISQGDYTTKTATGAVVNIQRSGTSVSDNDVLGKITFQTPDVTATPLFPGQLIAGALPAFQMVAESTAAFSNVINPTKLSFRASDQSQVSSGPNPGVEAGSGLNEIFSINPDGSVSLPYVTNGEQKLRFTAFQSTFDESYIGLTNSREMAIKNSTSPITDLTANIRYYADQHFFYSETGGGATPTYQLAMSIQNNSSDATPLYIKTESEFPVWIEDAGNGVGSLYLGSSFVTANRVNTTATELNMLDGSAKSTTSITIVDADAFVIIDGTTTKQIPSSDISSYVKGTGTSTPVKEAGLETIWIPASNMRPRLTDGFILDHVVNPGGSQNFLSEIEGFKCNSTDNNVTKYAEFGVALPKSWNGGTVTSRLHVINLTGSTADIENISLRAVAFKNGVAVVPVFGNAVEYTNGTATTSSATYYIFEGGAVTINNSPTGNGAELINFQLVSTAITSAASFLIAGVQIFFTTDAKNDA
jgi:hypothetical protein